MLKNIGNGLVKGLAFIAGTGIVLRFKLKPGESGAEESRMALERLDSLEARIAALEKRAATFPDAGRETKEVEALRAKLEETAAILETRVVEITRGIPSLVENVVQPHIDEIRTRLEAEARATLSEALRTLDQTIESRISSRMAAVEKALLTQSDMLSALSRRESESGAMIRRLANALDKLAQHPSAAPAPAPRPEPQALPQRWPPESQTDWAASGFRPRIIKEDEEKPRHRNPLTRI